MQLAASRVFSRGERADADHPQPIPQRADRSERCGERVEGSCTGAQERD